MAKTSPAEQDKGRNQADTTRKQADAGRGVCTLILSQIIPIGHPLRMYTTNSHKVLAWCSECCTVASVAQGGCSECSTLASVAQCSEGTSCHEE
eukprot:1145059-Pelagomonas_calceolata.AAC.6